MPLSCLSESPTCKVNNFPSASLSPCCLLREASRAASHVWNASSDADMAFWLDYLDTIPLSF